MIQRIQNILLGIALSTGPVFWFPIIGKIIYLKGILFSVLFLFFFKKIMHSRISFFFMFFSFLVFYYFSMVNYEDAFINKFLAVYMDLLFAWFFLCVGDCISLENLRSAVRISVVCCLGYCILFWICQIFGIIRFYPVEYSRELSNGTLSILRFSDTGWGFGRTQWSTCLSVFVPALFFFSWDKKKEKIWKSTFAFYLAVICIFSAQVISGGRGGVVASLLSFSFCLFFMIKRKISFIFLCCSIFVLFGMIVYFNQDFFRLTDGSVSIERNKQWSTALEILRNLPFWGYGDYGNASAMLYFDIPFAFHDSFLRFLFGFGFPALCEGLFILYLLARCFKNTLAHKDNVCIVALCGILLAGFICSFTEPNPIFVAFYWPFWWVSAGYLYNLNKEDLPENKVRTAECFNQEGIRIPSFQ